MEAVNLFLSVLAFQTLSVRMATNPYYQLWTTKFKSVQLEVDILREKVLEGERQLALMKNKVPERGISMCSPEERDEKADEDKDQTDPVMATTVLNAFRQEKHYVRHLGKQFEEWNKTVVSILNQIDTVKKENKDTKEILEEAVSRKWISNTEEALYARLVNRKETCQRSFRKKISQVIEKVNQLSERLAILNPIQMDQKSLGEKVTQISRSLNHLEDRRCQSGSTGDSSFPAIIFPKTFTVRFSTAFAKPPQFMYGLHVLDSSATVRINVHLIEVTKYFARLGISSWADTKLYAAYVRWMACP